MSHGISRVLRLECGLSASWVIACSMPVKWLTFVACAMARIGKNIDDWLN